MGGRVESLFSPNAGNMFPSHTLKVAMRLRSAPVLRRFRGTPEFSFSFDRRIFCKEVLHFPILTTGRTVGSTIRNTNVRSNSKAPQNRRTPKTLPRGWGI